MCTNQLLAFIGILSVAIIIPYCIGRILMGKPKEFDEYLFYWILGLALFVSLGGLIALLSILWLACDMFC